MQCGATRKLIQDREDYTWKLGDKKQFFLEFESHRDQINYAVSTLQELELIETNPKANTYITKAIDIDNLIDPSL